MVNKSQPVPRHIFLEVYHISGACGGDISPVIAFRGAPCTACDLPCQLLVFVRYSGYDTHRAYHAVVFEEPDRKKAQQIAYPDTFKIHIRLAAVLHRQLHHNIPLFKGAHDRSELQLFSGASGGILRPEIYPYGDKGEYGVVYYPQRYLRLIAPVYHCGGRSAVKAQEKGSHEKLYAHHNRQHDKSHQQYEGYRPLIQRIEYYGGYEGDYIQYLRHSYTFGEGVARTMSFTIALTCSSEGIRPFTLAAMTLWAHTSV